MPLKTTGDRDSSNRPGQPVGLPETLVVAAPAAGDNSPAEDMELDHMGRRVQGLVVDMDLARLAVARMAVGRNARVVVILGSKVGGKGLEQSGNIPPVTLGGVDCSGEADSRRYRRWEPALRKAAACRLCCLCQTSP